MLCQNCYSGHTYNCTTGFNVWLLCVNYFQQSSKLCLSAGWKHYNKSEKVYKQVYSVKGGGTTNLYMEANLNYDECVQKIEEVFFPDGKNGRQRLKQLERSLANYVGDPIKSTLTLPDGPCNFTVGTYCEYCKTQRKRIYLLTKDIVSPPVSKTFLF